MTLDMKQQEQLKGIERARSFTQNDSHIFCTLKNK